mgnify:CR=1 FL=1
MSARALLLSEMKPELFSHIEWHRLGVILYGLTLKAARMRLRERVKQTLSGRER